MKDRDEWHRWSVQIARMLNVPWSGFASDLVADQYAELRERIMGALNSMSSHLGQAALFAIAAEWRRDAEMHRNSCRLQEQAGRRDKADRHYQRSLDLDACAKRIEDLANAQDQA